MGPNMAKPRVFIVTPVHNSVERTLKFLASIQKNNYPNLSTVIVDDGSTDDTEERIKQAFPVTIILRGKGDLWWSGATNLGVVYAIEHGADYIYTVNNDVELAPDTISDLVAGTKAHPRSLIGNTIYDIDNKQRIWYYGGVFNRQKGILEHRDGENLKLDKPFYEAEWATGMGLLVPGKAYAEAGLYDTDYFPQYMGDADFSQRAKKADYKLLVSSQAKLYSDTKSAWIDKANLKSKPWTFPYQVFFSIRSPYWFRMRYMFYKRHWGKGWRLALWRANKLAFEGIVGRFLLFKLGLKK